MRDSIIFCRKVHFCKKKLYNVCTFCFPMYELFAPLKFATLDNTRREFRRSNLTSFPLRGLLVLWFWGHRNNQCDRAWGRKPAALFNLLYVDDQKIWWDAYDAPFISQHFLGHRSNYFTKSTIISSIVNCYKRLSLFCTKCYLYLPVRKLWPRLI